MSKVKMVEHRASLKEIAKKNLRFKCRRKFATRQHFILGLEKQDLRSNQRV